MNTLTNDQLMILRHACGLSETGRGIAYRNHFVTGEGCDDHAHCVALTDAGLMVRRKGNALTGGDDLFIVTDAGKDAARAKP